MTAILELQGVSGSIAGQQVLENITFTAGSGVTAILGRNGVGKTSTLKAIMGLIERSGKITYRGEDITTLPTHRIASLGIAYVPEDREVFASLTVTENLRIAIRRGTPGHWDRVYELFPELKTRATQLAGSLSGGQQQMVSLGRALMNDNDLLLVDEPTKGLAPRIVTEVTETLARAAELAPVVLVEQNLAVVRALAEQVVVISSGRVVHTGGAVEFLDDAALTARHLGVSAGDAPEEAPAPVEVETSDSTSGSDEREDA